KPGDKAEIYNVTNHFFTNICIGRTAYLYIFVDGFILDPDVMRWANLTKLQVDKADYATVCKAIGRLPNLCELTIRYLATGSFIEDSFLFTSADPMLAWGAKLAMVKITSLDKD
ncbi:hypothetical protein LPJ71_001328, partial [Coemansia sp. S17]